MAYDERLSERVELVLDLEEGVVQKKMFGGLAFMVKGNMAWGVHKDRLMVRVGPEGYEEALGRPHCQVMDITGRPMRGFVMVRPEGVSSDEGLLEWPRAGVQFALSLPEK